MMVGLFLRVCMLICLVGNPAIAQSGNARQGIISGCDQLRIGQKTKITAVVDDQFSDSCFVNGLSQVVFKTLSPSNTLLDVCTMSITPKTGNCATVQSDSRDCVCESKVGTIWTFTLNYHFTEGDRGKTLYIVPNCLPDRHYANMDRCSNLKPNSPCEGYNCNLGVCYEQGSTAKCNCTNSYHTGTRCEVSPCATQNCPQHKECVVLSTVWPADHTASCATSTSSTEEYCGLFECGDGCGCKGIWPIVVYSALSVFTVVMIRTYYRNKQEGKRFGLY